LRKSKTTPLFIFITNPLIFGLRFRPTSDFSRFSTNLSKTTKTDSTKTLSLQNQSRGAFRAEIIPLLPDADHAAVGIDGLNSTPFSF
jgi:hypothetical protein